MKITVKEYLELTYNPMEPHQVRAPIVCNDGFKVSIQGGTPFHYCLPREYCCVFQALELGFPSQPDELIAEYAADELNLTDTVYGYVPIEVVEQLIVKHGGIAGTTYSVKGWCN